MPSIEILNGRVLFTRDGHSPLESYQSDTKVLSNLAIQCFRVDQIRATQQSTALPPQSFRNFLDKVIPDSCIPSKTFSAILLALPAWISDSEGKHVKSKSYKLWTSVAAAHISRDHALRMWLCHKAQAAYLSSEAFSSKTASL